MRKALLLPLFLMIATLVTSVSAQTWQKLETPVMSSFALNDTVYLYNVLAKKFFTEGNAYGTQASLSADKPLKVCFTSYIGTDEEWDNKTLLFNDSSLVAKQWRKVFIDAKGGAYVDYSNDFFWQIEEIEGSTNFRIFPGDRNSVYNREEYGQVYLGLDLSSDAANTALSPLLIVYPDEETTYLLDWAMVTIADFNTWKLHNETVDAALTLNQLIAEAKAMGISTSAYEQVYNNTSSTLEQLQEACAAVRSAMVSVIEGSVTPSSPKDMTDFIINPQYENDDNTGWEGTAPGFDARNQTSCAERWNSNFDIYQTLTNLPKGIYQLEVQAFYRAGANASESYQAWLQGETYNVNSYLYAQSDDNYFTSTVKNIVADMQDHNIGGDEQSPTDGYFVPNNMVAAHEYFAANLYNNKMFVHVEGDDLTIGLKKETLISKDWTIWDNWRLTYYGNSVESYKFYLLQEMEAADPYLNSELYYSKALRTQLQTLKTNAGQVASKEDALALLDELKQLLPALQESVKAYADYLAICQEADEVIFAVQGTGSDALSDYLGETIGDMPYDELYSSGKLTTEEILAEIEKVQKLIANAYATSIEEGADITYIIANANFDKAVEGWSYDTTYPGRPVAGGLAANPNAEVFNANFDVYQEFADVPNGVYRMDVQAFFRSAGNDQAWAERETAEIKSFIYVNGIQTAIKNIMSEAQDEAFVNSGYYTTPEGTYVANNMNEASEAFSAGKYENTVYGVVTDGKMRIGIRQTDGTAGARWTIFDNFRLTYTGYNAETLREALNPLVEAAQLLISDSNIGAAEKAALTTLCTTAQTSTNGKELFQVLIDINSAIDNAKASISLYSQLNNALTDLYTALDDYSETASQKAIDQAGALTEEVENVLVKKVISQEEVLAYITKIDEAIVQLKFVDEVASDDNPIDVTSVIANPSFSSDNSEGWSGDVPGFDTDDALGMAEFYNCNYDIYQEFTGMKNGTYRLTVTGFYRAGSFDNDYSIFTSDEPSAGNNAYLYAVSGTTQASVALPTLCQGMSETQVNKGQGEVTVGGSYYVPNNMVAAAAYINAGRYPVSELIINVTDGTLRVGVKKDTHIGADWTFFDNFTLTYYGTDSALTPSDDPVAIDTLTDNVQQTSAIYNINGTRLSQLQRGINVVRMSDGSVRKIFVK